MSVTVSLIWDTLCFSNPDRETSIVIVRSFVSGLFRAGLTFSLRSVGNVGK